MEPVIIRALRESLRESQTDFACRFGVSQIAVAHWESGRSKPNAERQHALFELQLKEVACEKSNGFVPFRPIQYLGSKLRLAKSIAKVIDELAPSADSRVADLFAGSGVISHTLANSRPVTSVDVQAYSATLTRGLLLTPADHFLTLDTERFRSDATSQSTKVAEIFAPLIELEGQALSLATAGDLSLLNEIVEYGSLSAYLQRPFPGYSERLKKTLSQVARNVESTPKKLQVELIASRYFGGAYFSYSQAACLDGIYIAAKNWGAEYAAAALAVLLSTASEIVNTVGKQFAQPIKLRKPDGSTPKILLDRTIRDRSIDPQITFRVMSARWAEAVSSNLPVQHELKCGDVLDFVERDQSCSVFYADPPYTIDHYSRFYHVLETLVLRDQPRLDEMSKRGSQMVMRGIYRAGRHQSIFSIPSTAAQAF